MVILSFIYIIAYSWRVSKAMRKKVYITFIILALVYFAVPMFTSGPQPEVFETAQRNTRGTSPPLKTAAPKPFTLLVYMNGSDLESVYGAATDDILEMAASGFDEDLMNIVLFTGGSTSWMLPEIPDSKNTIFRLLPKDSNHTYTLEHLLEAGEASMGLAKTLSDFIRFGTEYFPAERTGLILWNHGGGAVVGYGADERFEHNPHLATMTLDDIAEALETGLRGNILEFLGFDTCLMATIEMAKIATPHARYLIASEEVEPEEGWDYTFLGDITKDTLTGNLIGERVVKRYAEFYETSELSGFITMSVTDLSKLPQLVEAFEIFASHTADKLPQNFRRLSSARRRTRNFGSGGEDGETDMVDIREMALQIRDTLGENPAIAALLSALDQAVIHNYENEAYDLGGLSVYYPYFNKENLQENVRLYKEINALPKYSSYMHDFSEKLLSRTSRTLSPAAHDIAQASITTWQKLDADGDTYIQISETPISLEALEDAHSHQEVLFRLEGRPACLYHHPAQERGSIPAVLNGHTANLIAVSHEGDWHILGAVPTQNGPLNTVDKKLIPLKPGDSLALRYYLTSFDEDTATTDMRQHEKWHTAREFTLQSHPTLSSSPHEYNPSSLRRLSLTDYQNNNHLLPLQ